MLTIGAAEGNTPSEEVGDDVEVGLGVRHRPSTVPDDRHLPGIRPGAEGHRHRVGLGEGAGFGVMTIFPAGVAITRTGAGRGTTEYWGTQVPGVPAAAHRYCTPSEST